MSAVEGAGQLKVGFLVRVQLRALNELGEPCNLRRGTEMKKGNLHLRLCEKV